MNVSRSEKGDMNSKSDSVGSTPSEIQRRASDCSFEADNCWEHVLQASKENADKQMEMKSLVQIALKCNLAYFRKRKDCW